MLRARIGLVALLALAIATSVLTGCGRKGLVNVNGEKVMKDEFYARLERVPVQTIKNGRPVTVPAGQYVIEQIIGEKLVAQLAEKEGVAPDEAQINKKVSFIKKNAGADFKMMLAQQGRSEDEWKRQVEVEQAFSNIITKGTKVPDADVKAIYDQQIKASPSPFIRPEQVRISIILKSDKAGIDKAYGLLKQGQDFGSVALKLSEHESKQAQGKIPTWLHKGFPQADPNMINKAFALQPGKFSEPFQSEGKWVVLKVDQKRPKKVQEYAEVKDFLREQVAMQKGAQEKDIAKKMQQFTKSAEITVNAERYKNVVDELKKSASGGLEMSTTPAGGAKEAEPK